MEIKNVLDLKINDISQVAEARRLTSYAVTAMGFNELATGKISIIVTELTNNLIKHLKQGGEFQLNRISIGNSVGIELVTIDKGPGMKNVAEAMRDGFSSSGSPGTGLGSITRMSDFFDIYSTPESGTVILSRLWLNKKQILNDSEYFDIGAILLPKPNEEVSGDKWLCVQNGARAMIIAADGLGHGIEASIAASEALKGFEANISFPLSDLMQSLNSRMKHTRGSAVAICEVDASNSSLQFCGIGNISASIITTEGNKNLISYNGIVGHEVKKIQTLSYPWSDNSLLIMHSDGIATRWNLDRYPGLFFKSLTIICSVLYRDFCRGNDDAMIIAVRKK